MMKKRKDEKSQIFKKEQIKLKPSYLNDKSQNKYYHLFIDLFIWFIFINLRLTRTAHED